MYFCSYYLLKKYKPFRGAFTSNNLKMKSSDKNNQPSDLLQHSKIQTNCYLQNYQTFTKNVGQNLTIKYFEGIGAYINYIHEMASETHFGSIYLTRLLFVFLTQA